MACAGSRKRPPSENESGVTLRIPMTSGRPGAKRRGKIGGAFASCVEREKVWPAKVICEACPGRGAKSSAWHWPRSIRDLQGQLLGVLDPTGDQLLGRQEAEQLALLVGL